MKIQIFQLLNSFSNRLKFTKILGQTIALVIGASVLFISTSANAAEQVVLKYGDFQGTISFQELSDFVETGKTTPTLTAYLQAAKQDPAQARKALKSGIKAEPAFLENLLSGWTGPILINQIGQVIHPPGKQLDEQALRTSVSKSISQEGEVTLLGAIRNYPDNSVEIEGDRLIPIYERLSKFAEAL